MTERDEMLDLAEWARAVPAALLSDRSPNAEKFERIAQILEGLAAAPAPGVREPQSSAEFHQQRGRYFDIVREAIAAYDDWMLDDDYEPMVILRKIITRMRDRAALASGEGK